MYLKSANNNQVVSIKLLLFFLIVFILPQGVFPAWLENVPISVTQPDGTVLECFATGDEFYRRVHDKDGFTIIKNQQTGQFVYAKRVGDELVPTQYVFGKSNPFETGLEKRAMINPDLILKKAEEFKSHIKKPTDNKKEKTQVNNFGTIRNVVIYIRFSGESEFTDDTSTYHNMHNAASGNSMFAYYKEASYNNLSIYSSFYPVPSSNIVKSYQDAQPRGYYQPFSSGDNPDGYTNGSQRTTREHTLLKNCVNAVSSEIPAGLSIDNDGDGYVDNVEFIVSGATDGWSDLLWPHRWVLYSQTVTINGKRVWDYNFQLRNSLMSAGNSVLCHEMGHTLGAPDFYHYNQDGKDPVGKWDLMASNTNTPQHMTAWTKKTYMGWISNIPEITTGGQYTLNPISSSTNNCYKITSPNSSTQFFMVEYRKKSATYFEGGIPASGLIVYRITPDSVPNGNANGPPDEMYVYRPGGTTTVNGTPDQANYSSEVSRTEISDATSPSCFLANGSAGGIHIYNIGTAGTTISFWIGMGLMPPDLVYPANSLGGIPLDVRLRWNDVPDANTYDVQVSTNPSFSSFVFNQTSIADTFITVTPDLMYNTTYYWRVRSVGSGTSEWSSPFSFLTVLEPPTLTIPLNNEFGVVLRDTLNWQTVPGANNYDVQISLNAGFTNKVLDQSLITNTYLIIPVDILENNTIYFWRVKAHKVSPSNESDWSTSRQFTSILASPVLLLPKNDSLGMGLSGIMSWQTVNGATTYNVQVSKNINFSTTVLNQTGLTVTNQNISDLEYYTTYYWRVQAVNSNQTGLWSEAFKFYTKLKPPTLATPSDGATGIDVDANLFWRVVNGGDSYSGQVASDSGMTNIVFDNNNYVDTSLVCGDLESKTKYFWRIKAHNDDGRISDWSVKWSFTTTLGNPTLPSPGDNATSVPVEGMIVWNNVNGAEKYHAQLSVSDNFANMLINDSNLTATSTAYSNLEPGKTYFWRVRALTTTNTGKWSNIWSFKTGLGKVQLSSPGMEARGLPISGQLIWNAMTGAQTYNVQLSTDDSFNSKIIDETGKTGLTQNYSGLQSNKMHYWRVSAINESGSGGWSDTWRFFTTAGEPQLVEPVNNKGGMPLNGKLNWKKATGAKTYTLQFAQDTNMTDLFAEKTLADTFYVYQDLDFYTNYYWRVNAENDDGISPWTEVRRFTTLIAAPLLYSPETGILDAPIDGTLEWVGTFGATGYSIAISDKQDFSNLVVDEQKFVSTEFQYFGLLHNKKYYWRVMAENPDANSEWSETRNFLTILDKPQLDLPNDSATGLPYSGRVTWNTVEGAKKYRLQISKSPDFKINNVDKEELMFSFFDYSSLDENTWFYWRVNATNNNSTGDWSGTRMFMTKDPTDINDLFVNNFGFNAYPNPFTNSISFEISRSIKANSSIEIYNLIGRTVGIINLPENIQPGYIVKWQAEYLPQGVYNAVFKSGNETQTIRINLIY